MKKILLIILCIYNFNCFSQIPSIQEKYRRVNIKDDSKAINKELLNQFLTDFVEVEGISSNEDINSEIEKLLTSLSDEANEENKSEILNNIKLLNKINQLILFNQDGVLLKIDDSSLIGELDALGVGFEEDFSFFHEDVDKRGEGEVTKTLINSLAIPYYENKVETLKKELKQLEDITEFTSESELLIISDKIKKKREEITNYRKTLFKSKADHFWTDSFFPTSRSTRELAFESIYSKENEKSLYFGNEATLQFNSSGSGAVIETELASAYLGAFRVSFGSLLSNEGNNDESSEGDGEMEDVEDTSAFQRLVSKGGNAYLEIAYPLHYYQSKRAFTYIYLGARAGVEIKEFNTDVDTSNGVGSIFGNLYYSVSTNNNEFNFFTNLNYGLYYGGDGFYKRLSIEDEKAFGFGNFTAGVTIQGNVRVAVTIATLSSDKDLRNNNIMISTQILSSIFKKDN